MANHPGATLSDSIFERLLHERIIVLGQEIDDEVANRVIGQLLLLTAEDPRSDITLYLNSPGGSVSAGLAVYDTMASIGPAVCTVATGLAASTAQFLLTGGSTGKRMALPHAKVMMHQPSGTIGGPESDVVIRADMMRGLKRQVAEITAAHSGQPVDRIVADVERDRWFTPTEAVEYGLIDRVVGAGGT